MMGMMRPSRCVEDNCKNEIEDSMLDKCPSHSPPCPVCLDNLGNDEVVRMTCGHMYHSVCLYTWLNHNRNCPMCRKIPYLKKQDQ